MENQYEVRLSPEINYNCLEPYSLSFTIKIISEAGIKETEIQKMKEAMMPSAVPSRFELFAVKGKGSTIRFISKWVSYKTEFIMASFNLFIKKGVESLY